MKVKMTLMAIVAFLAGMLVSGIVRDPRPAQADEQTSELRRQTQAIQQVATEIRELRYVVKAKD
jgi:outer membrane murein-binding lipoprotein Lpp